MSTEQLTGERMTCGREQRTNLEENLQFIQS